MTDCHAVQATGDACGHPMHCTDHSYCTIVSVILEGCIRKSKIGHFHMQRADMLKPSSIHEQRIAAEAIRDQIFITGPANLPRRQQPYPCPWKMAAYRPWTGTQASTDACWWLGSRRGQKAGSCIRCSTSHLIKIPEPSMMHRVLGPARGLMQDYGSAWVEKISLWP